jgi:hypothetical protein
MITKNGFGSKLMMMMTMIMMTIITIIIITVIIQFELLET